MIRTTFYGKKINYKDLTHQHISNIIWFNKINHGRYSILSETESLKFSRHEYKEIDERFGGIVLPYKPLISFKDEIDVLEDNGYLKPIDNHNSNIIIDGKWIGEVLYT